MIRKLCLRTYYSFKNEVETSYDGEFGYELISVLPFAYWLYEQNKLSKTIGASDTKHFYYFSPNHEERFTKRDYVKPLQYPINNIHVHYLNTMMWRPPPLKTIYKNDEFVFEKPILILCNKYNSEWGFPPITFLDKPCLERLFKLLGDKYQIVYCRPENKEVVDDCSTVYSLEEHDWIRENFDQVLLIQDLHKEYSHYSFNELQLKLFANSDHFISIQGGYSIFASYFKGINLIYGAKTKHRTADEIKYNAYKRWYHKFSGSKILYSPTYDDLFSKVALHYL